MPGDLQYLISHQSGPPVRCTEGLITDSIIPELFGNCGLITTCQSAQAALPQRSIAPGGWTMSPQGLTQRHPKDLGGFSRLLGAQEGQVWACLLAASHRGQPRGGARSTSSGQILRFKSWLDPWVCPFSLRISFSSYDGRGQDGILGPFCQLRVCLSDCDEDHATCSVRCWEPRGGLVVGTFSSPCPSPCPAPHPLEKPTEENQGSPQRKENSHEMGLTVAFGVT